MRKIEVIDCVEFLADEGYESSMRFRVSERAGVSLLEGSLGSPTITIIDEDIPIIELRERISMPEFAKEIHPPEEGWYREFTVDDKVVMGRSRFLVIKDKSLRNYIDQLMRERDYYKIKSEEVGGQLEKRTAKCSELENELYNAQTELELLKRVSWFNRVFRWKKVLKAWS